ncbi:MAG TPA: pantoate--beta-alanine ligase [Stellaceae bacterium]|jgi:pantoate--beta-alanine ligase|nr:pantoate--beta-alanine ligase [Stellaceae bacterium]
MLQTIGSLPVARTVAELRRAVADWRRADHVVALVPTMGALHAGHLALVAQARVRADRVIASIFVNPTQFGPSEDFARYPRDEAGDAAQLAAASCDLLYAPDVAEIYPAGFATTVAAGPLAEPLDGRFRPGHFAGVATVVTKLLLQTRPQIACFGEKDYQQLQIIRRVTRDLDIDCAIEGVPIVRESDGLALSSRNLYLTPEERRVAPALHRVLVDAVARVTGGAPPAEAGAAGAAALLQAGFGKIDYVEMCDAETLEPLAARDRPGRVLAAAWLGKTRLIDNEPIAARGAK